MATYNIPPVGTDWVTLPAPSADAWVQPLDGDILWTTAETPDVNRAFRLSSLTPFEVSAGATVKVRSSSGPDPVSIVMEDRP